MRLIFAVIMGLAAIWWIGSRMAEEADRDFYPDDDDANAPPPEPETPVQNDTAAPPPGKPNIAAAVGEPDDLTRIKGIGPALQKLCTSLGVTRFDQIAAWTEADIAEVDQYLKIKGRIVRDRWVDQAKLLAVGDEAGYKAEFG